MRFRPYFRATPRVRLSHPGAGCVARIPIIVVFLLALASTLVGQVTAVAEMKDGVADVYVGNPSDGRITVSVSLFRDATKDSVVTLGPPVDALVSPAAFVLEPHTMQLVRIRVRESVKPGELLRLVTVLDPRVAPDSTQAPKLTVVMRLITKIRVQ